MPNEVNEHSELDNFQNNYEDNFHDNNSNLDKKINSDKTAIKSDNGVLGKSAKSLAAGSGTVEGLTYEASGVNIAKADKLIEFIKEKSTKLAANIALNKEEVSGEVISGVGGFAALFSIENFQYKQPVIVSSTDGVGTKLLIANQINDYSAIGIDLVAMCVNDLLCHGAKPLFFLDYYATGRLNLENAKKVLTSIVEGCQLANIPLIGGETAELPGIYHGEDYDLAGFSVGIVERTEILPKKDNIEVHDILIGLPSSGIHSNGFSLVRELFTIKNIKYTDISPWAGKPWHEHLLKATKIYINEIAKIKSYCKAVAHITGGGILENTKRVLPSHLEIQLDYSEKDWPEIFKWLKETGNITEVEMIKTFNCGIGMVIVSSLENSRKILELLPEAEIIGSLKEIKKS